MGCDIHAYVDTPGVAEWESQITIKISTINRDYGLFSWLANVRNYSGTRPISDPKGLPSDVFKTIQRESDDWDTDGHSHSWHMIRDLLAADKISDFPEFQSLCVRLIEMAGSDARLVFWFDN
jgi:hypothetical protein